jgi:hypothetical protein
MPEIRKTMCLSTGHTPEGLAAKLLETDAVAGGNYGDYGWFMYAHDEDINGDIGPELMRVFEYARSHGCGFVVFDCDADTIDELPTWDW